MLTQALLHEQQSATPQWRTR